MSAMANPMSVDGMMMRGQLAASVGDFAGRVPQMSAYERGYFVGYASEKILESLLVSRGVGAAAKS